MAFLTLTPFFVVLLFAILMGLGNVWGLLRITMLGEFLQRAHFSTIPSDFISVRSERR